MRMKDLPFRLSLGEWIAVAGAVLSVFYQVVSTANATLPGANWAKVLGIALFLGGILVTLRDLVQASKNLQSDYSVLGLKLDIAKASGWTVRDTAYVRATGEVLEQMLSVHVPAIAGSVKRFINAPKMEIDVPDHSPIFDLMHRLGRENCLPKNSAWLGITLLDSQVAWATPLDDNFTLFAKLMRKRAKNSEIVVCRLYYFHSVDSFNQMREQLKEEANNKIVVKYLVADGHMKPPKDVSILWLPSAETTRVSSDTLRAFADDAATALEQCKLRPMCALNYATAGGSLITKLSINPSESDAFQHLSDEFIDHWRLAHLFAPGDEARIGPAPHPPLA